MDYGGIFRSCHLLTLDSCHVALQKDMAKITCLGKERVAICLQARAVAVYPAKNVATDMFG